MIKGRLTKKSILKVFVAAKENNGDIVSAQKNAYSLESVLHFLEDGKNEAPSAELELNDEDDDNVNEEDNVKS
jgi:hypothetical protein